MIDLENLLDRAVEVGQSRTHDRSPVSVNTRPAGPISIESTTRRLQDVGYPVCLTPAG